MPPPPTLSLSGKNSSTVVSVSKSTQSVAHTPPHLSFPRALCSSRLQYVIVCASRRHGLTGASELDTHQMMFYAAVLQCLARAG